MSYYWGQTFSSPHYFVNNRGRNKHRTMKARARKKTRIVQVLHSYYLFKCRCNSIPGCLIDIRKRTNGHRTIAQSSQNLKFPPLPQERVKNHGHVAPTQSSGNAHSSPRKVEPLFLTSINREGCPVETHWFHDQTLPKSLEKSKTIISKVCLTFCNHIIIISQI